MVDEGKDISQNNTTKNGNKTDDNTFFQINKCSKNENITYNITELVSCDRKWLQVQNPT